MDESRVRRVGWGLVILVSGLLILDGIVWFFVGPRIMWFQDVTGVPLSTFRDQYPIVADHMAASARQVAIWMTAFGTLAGAVGVVGFRRGSRWAWLLSWIVVAFLATLAVNYAFAGEDAAVLGIFSGGALLCAAGLVLARHPATETQAEAALEQ